jgi:GTP-binding protein Era
VHSAIPCSIARPHIAASRRICTSEYAHPFRAVWCACEPLRTIRTEKSAACLHQKTLYPNGRHAERNMKNKGEPMNQKSAFVAIVGKPNVGKSSLLNTLLGEKIAIVSSKPQTTRTRITGVLTEQEYQWVFIDTPGFHKPKTKLSNQMNKIVTTSVGDVDLALFLVEPMGRLTDEEQALIESFRSRRLPVILVINKIDLIDKDQLLQRIAEISAYYDFAAVVPISVTEGNGIDALRAELAVHTEEGPHYFPDDTLTDQPEKVIASEIIREKILCNMRDEIPHGTAVSIEKMRER